MAVEEGTMACQFNATADPVSSVCGRDFGRLNSRNNWFFAIREKAHGEWHARRSASSAATVDTGTRGVAASPQHHDLSQECAETSFAKFWALVSNGL